MIQPPREVSTDRDSLFGGDCDCSDTSSPSDISKSSDSDITNRASGSENSDSEFSDTDAPRLIAVIGVFLTAVTGVLSLPSSSPSVSVLVMVHSHFLFFSLRFRFRVPGVSKPLSAILLLISSNGPGVWPPSRVSLPVYAMANSNVWMVSASGSGSVAE